MSERNELQVLLNEPQKLVIGTADNPRTVEIREPSNAQLGEYLAIINASMMKLLKDNVPLINAAVAGKDTSKIDFNMAALAEIMDLLVAKIVGESIEYVQNEMSARQNAAIVRAFLDVLGWEFIKENFQQAMRAYQAAGSKKQNSAAPPWPHASSPKSAENTPN